MPSLTQVTTLTTGTLGTGARVTDMVSLTQASGTYLYLGAQPGFGLYALSLAEGQAAALLDTNGLPAGADVLGATRLDILPEGAGNTLLTPGRFGAEMGGFALSANGWFGGARGYSDGAGPGGDVTDVAVVRVGGEVYLYGAVRGADGVAAWHLPSGQSALVQGAGLVDSPAIDLADVMALTSATFGATTWLFAASGSEDGLAAMKVGPGGVLTHIASMGAAEGLGIDAPLAVEAVAVGGQGFVILAGAGSSSLTVFRVEAGGLVPVDHVTDTLGTRLMGVEALATATLGDRVFVLAGGADDGVSLFELLPDGRLFLHQTLEDANGLALADVRAIEAVAVGGEIQVFVTSGSEDGVSQFTLDPGNPGATLFGTATGEALAGGGADEVVAGMGGNDTLSGGGGADIMIDGSGADVLTGGAGADVFVFISDGLTDRVTDFNPAEDRLDLSDFAMLQSLSQLAVTPTATGAILSFGDEVVEVVSHNGQPLTLADFTDAGVLNLPRSPSELVLGSRIDPATAGADLRIGTVFADTLDGLGGNDTLKGGWGDDTLSGGQGDDALAGGAGSDALDGGAGEDLADYSGAKAGVVADLAAPGANTGEAAGDTYAGIEGLVGSAFADRLTGDGAANLINGGEGADTLAGGGGDDRFVAGAGADAHDGGAGIDTVSYAAAAGLLSVDLMNPARGTGEALGDSFVGIEAVEGGNFGNDLRGDAWSNRLTGGNGVDWLTGRAGNDTLIGGGANDNLIGGTGADLLDGGAGFDRAHYSDATAGVVADLQDASQNAGAAAGDVYVSVEGLRGSNFADDLRGDGGANGIDGGSGNDLIAGRGGSDQLIGRGGNDTLDGGEGNDVLYGGAGADVLIGGNGTDRANYGDSTTGLVADLLTPSANTGIAVGDTYQGIENLQGGIGNDDLRGDDGANMITGGKGNDRLAGRDGADFLIGAEGADTLAGGAGADLLHGGTGADEFAFDFGGGGDRVLDFEVGTDTLVLGGGLPGLAGLTAAEIVEVYATDLGADVFFDFGGGDTLLVRNVADPSLLVGDIFVM